MEKLSTTYQDGLRFTAASHNATNAAVNALIDTIPTVSNHESNDTGTSNDPYVIGPNVLHIWGTIPSLYLDLDTPVNGMVNEYMFRFTAGSNFVLSLESTIRWAVEPTYTNGNTYEVSIIDNLAISAEFEPAS